MTRDGMPRAYLRIDPNIDQTMPDLETFIRLMCAAARQPERGRFRDRSLLDRAIGRTKAARSIARGDVVTLPDGRLYVVGWDEWQEGDYTVAERMRRMRARRAGKRNGTVSYVTPPSSPRRNDVTTDAAAVQSTNGDVVGTSTGDGDGDVASLAGYDGRADLEAFCLVTRSAPSAKQRRVLDLALQGHDETGPQWAADLILAHPDDPIGAVIAADKAWRAERIAAAQTAERKPSTPRRRAVGLTGVNAELAALLRAQEVAR